MSLVNERTQHHISEHCNVNVIVDLSVRKNDEMIIFESLYGEPLPFVIVEGILGLRRTQYTISWNSCVLCSGFHICYIKVFGGTL
jgi:hypothetical protein